MGRIDAKLARQVLRIAAYAAVSAMAALVFLPWFHRNESAATVIVTIYSVLAGFVVAVMAIVADDRALRGRTWRHDVFYMKSVQSQLVKQKWTFQLYLAILVLSLLNALDLPLAQPYQRALEAMILFLAFFGLLQSFRLPSLLTDRHVGALAQEIRRRRKEQDGASADANGED